MSINEQGDVNEGGVQYQDNFYHKGIPTTYRGVNFRSRLEARIANYFDKHSIRWEYEKKAVILSDGRELWPDFYLPELKTWVEVKGVITDFDIRDFTEFAKEFHIEVMLISMDRSLWFSGDMNLTGAGGGADDCVTHRCSRCGKIFFCGNCDGYNCRNCGNNDGGSVIPFNGFRKLIEEGY
jgi:hypothetical protein